MIRGVTHLKASADPKVTLICLSNSNQVFINTILKVCHGFRWLPMASGESDVISR
jgi:hypothetical protein